MAYLDERVNFVAANERAGVKRNQLPKNRARAIYFVWLVDLLLDRDQSRWVGCFANLTNKVAVNTKGFEAIIVQIHLFA
jgi:hypothetical protein